MDGALCAPDGAVRGRHWRATLGFVRPIAGTSGAPPPLHSRGRAMLNACHSRAGMLLGQAGLAVRDAWVAGAAVEANSSPPPAAQLQHCNPTFRVRQAAHSSLTSARGKCRGSCNCEDRSRR